MADHILTTKLGKVEYSLFGIGQPILFIHGGHSNSCEGLATKGFDLKKYQLIIPSRPGYGNTLLDDHKTPRKAADLLIALIDEISIDEIVVYGISAGGLTAIELAANYPERVKKLVLASAISKKWLNRDDKIYRKAQIIFNPKYQKWTWSMVRIFSRLLPNLIGKSFHPQFSKKPYPIIESNDVQELIHALKKYDSGEGFVNDLEQTIDESTLERIECPTLIIHSEYDNSVPFEHAINARDKIKGSVLECLTNEWGHLFWIGRDSDDSIKKTLYFIEG
ncbi:alpha/beta hydrolase [uncultured Pontibacter sp.]|uniref:alpha/beta fold hydrolase n=1 Tax=uncultured Pontibacter sp. TaxID=453356 RepID=UPI002612CD47|nr:alpha/beta hydrolase [uncultured Pontibacter sp.]